MKSETVYILYPICFGVCYYVLRWLPFLTNVVFSSLISFIVLNLFYIPDTYSIYSNKVALFYYVIMVLTLVILIAYGLSKAFDVVADHTILLQCDSTDPNRKCII